MPELNLLENKSSNLKHALFDRNGKIRTFAIFTAENPQGQSLPAEENNKRTKELYKALSQTHYYYIKVNGVYNDTKEHSVMVVNITFEDALYYVKKYDQQSFFYADSDNIRYYEYYDGEYVLRDTSNQVSTVEETEEFFSKYHDFNFNIMMSCFESFNEQLSDDFNEEFLTKSLDSTKTAKSRWLSRCNIYWTPKKE